MPPSTPPDPAAWGRVDELIEEFDRLDLGDEESTPAVSRIVGELAGIAREARAGRAALLGEVAWLRGRVEEHEAYHLR